jgi:hypothetical protein
MIARISRRRDGAAMWNATLLVEHELPVDAAADTVWALIRSPAALSARPDRFAFDVPVDVAGTDRLCCLLADDEAVTATVHDVRQEIEGQMICWQARGTQPAGQQALTLAVAARPGGSTLRLSVSDVVSRLRATSQEAQWQTHLKAWADSLSKIAEGRAPWPPAEMPVRMQQKCSVPRTLTDSMRVSAAAVVHAPAAAVWETVVEPETLRRVNPQQVAHAGHVPGTPQRKAGDMQYVIYRHPGERFTANVSVVMEFTEGVSALTQGTAPPHVKVYHHVTPVAYGTRVDLECRWPAPAAYTARKIMAADVTKQLQETVAGYKALIEDRAGSG